MEFLLLNRKILGLARPKVENGSDHVERISDTNDDFVCHERHLDAKGVVRLNKPAIVVNFTFSTESAKLQTVVQSIV